MRKGKDRALGGCPNACRMINRTSSAGKGDAGDGLGSDGTQSPLLAIECESWLA